MVREDKLFKFWEFLKFDETIFLMKAGGPPRMGVWESGIRGERRTEFNFI